MNGLEIRGTGDTWAIYRCGYMSGILATITRVDDTTYPTEAAALTQLRALVRQQSDAAWRARFPHRLALVASDSQASPTPRATDDATRKEVA